MSTSAPGIVPITDEELVRGCLAGDANAQTYLYNTYFTQGGPVYYWVYQQAYWIPGGDKEDMLNDIFLAVISSLEQFEFKCSLRTYVVRIAKIKCLDAMPTRLGLAKGRGIRFVDVDQRETDDEPVLQIEDPARTNRPDHFFDKLDEAERVYLLHKSLLHYTGPRCREVIMLYIQELHEEITREDLARQLGVSVERAGQMIYDCLYRLRKKIRQQFRDYEHFSDYMRNRPDRRTDEQK